MFSIDVLRIWIKYKSSGNRGVRYVKGFGDRFYVVVRSRDIGDGVKVLGIWEDGVLYI